MKYIVHYSPFDHTTLTVSVDSILQPDIQAVIKEKCINLISLGKKVIVALGDLVVMFASRPKLCAFKPG